ncbi:MAG: 5-bromo-4-chloroindolyl phosphate hydrolysis family protein [Peptostreptococcus sp.]|uniref:5-bromo-4-chloroindolyl phosphate hydrolysis family protein n=1 Tax=Peptostreptococcus TaxID=1257 RepID=UPI00290D7FDC|nr:MULTISPECIES: 5-bromo-4-chloroindolyl phosphate hydrolysis family protein [Peptostreptococcus]MDU5349833.1 5-bromo-4-chloroindolyl phosphate hydrolysis family protein [Peptostreptococcus sp.]MDU5567215.1 5-bromo-4-chloroindolyl phosphate hydrolysis family protein [Peptostreptococcus anaerobius]MDU5890704.1 5-bromo-4-chloroindolyl phosphate hydrolysis family protein [Peptostreptococcus sp.]
MRDSNYNRRNFDHDYRNRSRYDEETDSYYDPYEEYRRDKDISSYIGRSVDDMLRGMNLGGLNDKILKTVDMAIDEVNRSTVYKIASRAGESLIKPIYDKEIKRQKFINKNKLLDRLTIKPKGLYTSIGFMVPSFVLAVISFIVGVVFYSLSLGSYGVFVVGGLMFTGIGGIFASRILNCLNFKSYTDAIDENGYGQIEDMAKKTGRSKNKVIKDLRRYIKNGNFIEGHIVEDDTIFLASDELYSFYKSSLISREKNMKKEQEIASNQDLKNLIDACQNQIEKIRDITADIDNLGVKNKVLDIEGAINNIVDAIKKYPDQIRILDRFTSYYMPTTVKLLESYRDIESKGISTSDIDKVKLDIESTLDTIKLAYDKLLDQISAIDTMDINSDISVLKTMLTQDGLYSEANIRGENNGYK